MGIKVEIANLVTKLFGPPLGLGSYDRFSTHVDRWKIFGNQHLGVYLDHSVGTDWGSAADSCPERFISVGLAESSIDRGPDLLPDHSAWMLLIGKALIGRNDARPRQKV
jgi:hypothetical protein